MTGLKATLTKNGVTVGSFFASRCNPVFRSEKLWFTSDQ